MKRRIRWFLQSWGFCLPSEVDPRFDRHFRASRGF